MNKEELIKREEEIKHDAEQERKGLGEDIAGIAVVICRAGNDHNTEAGGQHAQKQQKQIALAEELPEGLRQFLHDPASFRELPPAAPKAGRAEKRAYYFSINCR